MNKTIENLSAAIREIAAQEAEKHTDIVIGEIAEKNSDGTYDVFIVPDFVTPVTNIPNSSIYDFNIGEGCYIRKYNNQLQSSAIVDKIGFSQPRFGTGGESSSSVSGSLVVGKTSELQNDGSDGVHPFIDTSALLQSNPMFYPSTSEDKIFSAKAVSSGFTVLTEQVAEALDTKVAVNEKQDFTDSQKRRARTNIGAASQGDIEGINSAIGNCVQVVEQTFTEEQKTQARTNIGAASQAELDNDIGGVLANIADCVQVTSQTFTNDQKAQARTNIGALSSADLSVWAQRVANAEEDLNTLSNVENGKAFISKYIATTTNTPSDYGNIISFRNNEGGSSQIALETQNGKMFYRSSSTPDGFGTWREVDIIVAKNLGTKTGYVRYSSGLIIQWGITNSTDGSWTGIIDFPIAFTSKTSYIPVIFPSSQTVSVSYSNLEEGRFSFGRSTSSGAFDVYWTAIGY